MNRPAESITNCLQFKEGDQMSSDYVTAEVIEIGRAEELILGNKVVPEVDENGESTMPDNDLDD